MGSTSSKFKKFLQHGDEYAAMQIYQSSPELRKNLDPNMSYGESHNHNTALHYAAKHGMKHLLRTFLNDLNGNPNKQNGLNETILHSACQLNQSKSFGGQERRAACVQLLLYWKGVALSSGGREKVNLAAQDKEGNTALHYAAYTGLRKCVELLLAHGSPVFTENEEKLTPCDVAMKASHHDIARLLESRMVFANNPDIVNEDEIQNDKEVYSGLRSQDLQEAKDQLLVDTSDMLKIPLFTAEALLRDNEWSREVLLEQWMKNPVECCQLAGVQAPPSALHHGSSVESSTSPDNSEEHSISQRPDILCEICYLLMSASDQTSLMSCKHIFCKSCWESYLTTKIQDGDAHHILCPAYQCHILVPVELIEKLVSPEMARRYLQFDIRAFVDSNRSIKWCPIPGCGRAVRLPESEQLKQLHKTKSIPNMSHAVDCGNAHFFCWECLGEAHAPSGCKQWQEWQMKIAEVKPEELKASCSETEDAANFLWLVTNSKPCPNCKSPIQKNEGCNHMKCSKCKFDFCWVCQESWKRHSSATGGYFRCNRFEAVQKADEHQGGLISDALDRNNQMQEMSRFLHFYTRFRNHENSQKLEEPLLLGVQQKMEVLASSLGVTSHQDIIDKGTKFIEDGVRELLKARRILCGSYVYGFYLEDNGYNKSIFEFMQNELEEVTEKLSEMIARPYLRTPKTVIVQTTLLARRKRHEFVRAVAQGLVPPETPPIQRKARKRRYLDTELSQSGTWLHDFEWPQYSSDNEENDVNNKHFSQSLNSPNKHECNLRCSKHGCGNVVPDCNMELVIALEMSRLQMIEDRMKQAQQQSTTPITPDPSSSISNNSESSDDQLKLAIQLSLQETATNALNRQSLNPGSLQTPSTTLNLIPPPISPYKRTSADITVDHFLKSLANHRIDFKHLEATTRLATTNDNGITSNDTVWCRSERECLFKSCRGNEDGRFQISDIHENGFPCFNRDDFQETNHRLKRSHSTGDIFLRPRIGQDCGALAVRLYGDEPHRYHLDSDHSSRHDDRPEDTTRPRLTPPVNNENMETTRESNSTAIKQFPLLHYDSYPNENGGQSSIDETTTTSDSINADMEVCGILESATDDEVMSSKVYSDKECQLYVNLAKKSDYIPAKCSNDSQSSKKIEATKTVPNETNVFASLKAKICSTHLPRSSYLSRMSISKSKGLLTAEDNTKLNRRKSHGEEKHEKKDEKLFSKSTGFLLESEANNKSYKFLGKNVSSKLRIKICKTPDSASNKTRVLETDSSNEYESETGIPKSPTLFISGVSISRTPEPKSPGTSLSADGRQSRSSSLSVPVPLSTCSLNVSSSSLNLHNPPTLPPLTPNIHIYNHPSHNSPEPFTPSLIRSTTPLTSYNHLTTTSATSAASNNNSSPAKMLSAATSIANKENNNATTATSAAVELGSGNSNGGSSSTTTGSSNSASTKTQSASEPEREREMFRFPKSSTDGALSSVLHVQESNLSSDDFHEALFLLERSPKRESSSKRRKKSKRKEKEENRQLVTEEVSSAL